MNKIVRVCLNLLGRIDSGDRKPHFSSLISYVDYRLCIAMVGLIFRPIAGTHIMLLTFKIS